MNQSELTNSNKRTEFIFQRHLLNADSYREVCQVFLLYTEIVFELKTLVVYRLEGNAAKQIFKCSNTKMDFSETVAPDFMESSNQFQKKMILSHGKTWGFILFTAPLTDALGPRFESLFDVFSKRLFQCEKRESLLTEFDGNDFLALKSENTKLKEESEKMFRFFSRMSHEIRTPLNSIIGLSEVLQNSLTSKENSENIAVLNNASHILLHIINDILDLAKMRTDTYHIEYASFNLIGEVQKLYYMMQKSCQKELNFFFESNIEDGDMYLGDLSRIKQVLLNLLGNAIKFTEVGYIKLEVKKVSDNRVIFKVDDSGVGIPDDDKQKIFDEFEQVKSAKEMNFQGTGLGLSISKKLIELMGGTIWVRDNENLSSGSSFSFYLPLVQGQSVKPAKEECKNKACSNAHVKIMVVDDTPMNLFLMKKILSELPCEVDYFENGNDAVSSFKKEQYDLILMDLQMPELSGEEATEKIRYLESEKGRDAAHIYALTADVYKKETDLVKNGFNGKITKPIKRDYIASLIADPKICSKSCRLPKDQRKWCN